MRAGIPSDDDQAFARLLELAAQRDSGQMPRIARFLAAMHNSRVLPLDLFELRAVDIAVSDNRLCCLDALCWARADLYTPISDGGARMRPMIDCWGFALAQRSLTAERNG